MELNPADLKVFLNHIYEFKKGVRRMVLYTTNKKYEDFAVKRLANQRIKFIVQQVDDERINLFFGCDECIEAIRLLVNRPLNKLTPEEDFILGAMLGYDICVQCRRWDMTSACNAAGIATGNSERWYRKCEDCKVLDYIEIN